VRGIAAGLLGPVDLELRVGGELESFTVTQDGALAFTTRLQDGDAYTVVLIDPDAPCALRDATGVVTGADPAIELTCTGPLLASVAVSGVPGAPIALSLGDNPVDIVVENRIGWQQPFHLTLRRAAVLAQYAYGKASNTDLGDVFGTSVALSGDTLAVGAYEESSAATGVNGDLLPATRGEWTWICLKSAVRLGSTSGSEPAARASEASRRRVRCRSRRFRHLEVPAALLHRTFPASGNAVCFAALDVFLHREAPAALPHLTFPTFGSAGCVAAPDVSGIWKCRLRCRT
jgi:hypothetical protein